MGIALDYETGRLVVGHYVKCSREEQRGHKEHHNVAVLVAAFPDYAVIKPFCHGGRHEHVSWRCLTYCASANGKVDRRAKPRVVRGGFSKE